MCNLSASEGVEYGHVKVSVNGREPGVSTQLFFYQVSQSTALTIVKSLSRRKLGFKLIKWLPLLYQYDIKRWGTRDMWLQATRLISELCNMWNLIVWSLQDPQLYSLTPVKGPMAGGTKITIFGTKLSTGDQITVTVGGLPCELWVVAFVCVLMWSHS